MASSQVQFAAPFQFGCVSPGAACHEHIKNFEQDNLDDSWVSRVSRNNLGTLGFLKKNHVSVNEKEDSSLSALMSPRHSATVKDHHHNNHHHDNHKENPLRCSSFVLRSSKSCAPADDSSSVADISHLAASSLVRIWEKRLHHYNNEAQAQVQAQAQAQAPVSPVPGSPRIRGRRAFSDLLLQFENDRYRELKDLALRAPVSKFTQRGRIQSVLKLRLLQRGVAEAFDQSAISKMNKNNQPQGYAIKEIRERFGTGIKHKSPAPTIVSDPGMTQRNVSNNMTEPKQNAIMQTSSNNKELDHSSSYLTFQGQRLDSQNDDDEVTKEITITPSPMIDSNANKSDHNIETSEQKYSSTANTTEACHNHTSEKENGIKQQQCTENCYDEIEEEEEEIDDQTYDEDSSYDWISPISRPRSYWEERRQEWYREMLGYGSDNDEIRNLLQRKTVSTFLSTAEFREKIDRLMMSRTGSISRTLQGDDGDDDDYEERRHRRLMEFFKQRLNSSGSPQESGRDEEARGNEEEKRINNHQEGKGTGIINHDLDHESSDCSSNSSPTLHTPSPVSSWSYKDGELTGDEYDRVTYISSQPQPPPPQSECSCQHRRQFSSSSSTPSSIEMDFLYDMRGQMGQLFREISELRNSINSCISMQMQMQMQMQQFKNQDVYSAKKEEEQKLNNNTSKKGKCRICNDSKVEAVFYRCGHMCACLKCANELQWKGENCPICMSPVFDVVRVYDE
ncbi:hypothetical protein HN51_038261 [Arachis hypogaea]|uniref:uncharacterized protein n=1 Tax=Arachis hypogaea TaxID=3818 RepID=UPI000DEC4D3F|nr:uncharacterized protein LOC112792445 [Arachis hypogaea]QHO03950.1 E3 ubiquitin-protein ligase NEURL1B [Arachis hypogaea]